MAKAIVELVHEEEKNEVLNKDLLPGIGALIAIIIASVVTCYFFPLVVWIDCYEQFVYFFKYNNVFFLNLVYGSKLPSVLESHPDFSGVVAIGSLESGARRLALLGGPAGVCAAMRRRGIEPDAKAFGFMMDAAEGTAEAESALLAFMAREGVKPDAIMLNMLVGRKVALFGFVYTTKFSV